MPTGTTGVLSMADELSREAQPSAMTKISTSAMTGTMSTRVTARYRSLELEVRLVHGWRVKTVDRAPNGSRGARNRLALRSELGESEAHRATQTLAGYVVRLPVRALTQGDDLAGDRLARALGHALPPDDPV
ncbi:hypothetical protein ACWD0G_08070 [Streptomyces goshikiensis]